MTTFRNHSITLVIIVLLYPAYGVEVGAQQPTEGNPPLAESTAEEVRPSGGAAQASSEGPIVPWAFTVLATGVLLVLVALLVYRLFASPPQGRGRGIDEVKPRVLIGGMMGVLLLYGFFFTLYRLLEMLPRDETEARGIPGEYWLFIGQALGIIGSLALNVATYYFGSASSGEDDGRSQGATGGGDGQAGQGGESGR